MVFHWMRFFGCLALLLCLAGSALASGPFFKFYKAGGAYRRIPYTAEENPCNGQLPLVNGVVTLYMDQNAGAIPLAGREPAKPSYYRSHTYPCANRKVHGTAKAYFPDGRIQQTTPYVNGQIHGVQQSFHHNGTPNTVTPYQAGKKHGLERQYDQDKVLRSASNYRNGQLHGTSRYRDRYKQVDIIYRYENGNSVGEPAIETQHLQEGLITAAGSGYLGQVKKYLAKGAQVNGYGESEYTPETALIAASNYGKKETVSLLLDRGADVNRWDRYRNRNPLIAAATGQGEKVRILQMLLAKGAQVNARSRTGETALHAAAQYGDSAVVATLLKAGGDPKAKAENGETPVSLAKKRGEKAILALLSNPSQAGAHLKSKQAEQCKKEAEWLARLVEVGETRRFNDYMTTCKAFGIPKAALNEAMLKAAASNRLEMLKTLHQAGGSVSARDSYSQETPLHKTVDKSRVEAARYLLANGANLNVQDTWGYTPLMRAAAAGDLALTRLFLQYGASLQTKTPDGYTVFTVHRVKRNPAVEALLQQAKTRR